MGTNPTSTFVLDGAERAMQMGTERGSVRVAELPSGAVRLLLTLPNARGVVVDTRRIVASGTELERTITLRLHKQPPLRLTRRLVRAPSSLPPMPRSPATLPTISALPPPALPPLHNLSAPLVPAAHHALAQPPAIDAAAPHVGRDASVAAAYAEPTLPCRAAAAPSASLLTTSHQPLLATSAEAAPAPPSAAALSAARRRPPPRLLRPRPQRVYRHERAHALLTLLLPALHVALAALLCRLTTLGGAAARAASAAPRVSVAIALLALAHGGWLTYILAAPERAPHLTLALLATDDAPPSHAPSSYAAAIATCAPRPPACPPIVSHDDMDAGERFDRADATADSVATGSGVHAAADPPPSSSTPTSASSSSEGAVVDAAAPPRDLASEMSASADVPASAGEAAHTAHEVDTCERWRAAAAALGPCAQPATAGAPVTVLSVRAHTLLLVIDAAVVAAAIALTSLRPRTRCDAVDPGRSAEGL